MIDAWISEAKAGFCTILGGSIQCTRELMHEPREGMNSTAQIV
jgi:hypothetical protein